MGIVKTEKFTLDNGTEMLREIYGNGMEIERPSMPDVPTPMPEPTDTELIMQALSDTEIRDIEARQERELLAQQMTDMELMLWERSGAV